MAFDPLNTRQYIENCLSIRTKQGDVLPFRLNPPQLKMYAAMRRQREAGHPVRLIVLKARQMGFSTLIGGTIFHRCATGKHKLGFVVSHDDKSTKKLFEMHKRFLDLLPVPMRPQVAASNGYQIVFDRPARSRSPVAGLDSRVEIATAGGSGIGRGSTIQYAHLSEYAFWPGDPNENYVALMQAVPDDPDTIVVIESTANGYNDFKDKWDAACERERRGELDGFLPVFFAWFEMPEYRRCVPPGFQRTPDEEELAARYDLSDQQLQWRRWCIENNCGGSMELFHQEYPSCPEEAFLATGTCVFDQQALIRRMEEVRELPWNRGEFRVDYHRMADGTPGLAVKQWQWREDKRGGVRILRPPEKGVPYVLGADTAGEGSDWFAAHVLDNRTGEQVAVAHQQYGERQFTEQLFALGKFYNDALIGIEVNFSTFPNELIQLMGYRRLYVRQAVDDYEKSVQKKFGFRTDTRTRPLIIDGLKDVVRQNPELINDYDTLSEMLTFVKSDTGKAQAEEGKHDDLVMSLAISHFIRTQQRTTVRGEGAKRKWTRRMLEEYWEAEEPERREMERRWGRPEEEDDDDE